METMERIEALKREIEQEKHFVRDEELKIERLQDRCEKVAKLLCEKSMEVAQETMNLVFYRTTDSANRHGRSDNKAVEWTEVESGFRALLKEELINPEALLKETEIWPHIGGTMLVNLRGQLIDAQVQLKGIENKMLDGTRTQLRKRAIQMEETKARLNRMEQAVLSLESWEKLYLMFMEDMEIRRESGMDDQFYRMERQDIKGKLNTCMDFCEIISRPVEAGLSAFIGKSAERVSQFLDDRGYTRPGDGSSSSPLPLVYRGEVCLNEELNEEIMRYSVGILFIEKHLYNIDSANEKQKAAEHELNCLALKS